MVFSVGAHPQNFRSNRWVRLSQIPNADCEIFTSGSKVMVVGADNNLLHGCNVPRKRNSTHLLCYCMERFFRLGDDRFCMRHCRSHRFLGQKQTTLRMIVQFFPRLDREPCGIGGAGLPFGGQSLLLFSYLGG